MILADKLRGAHRSLHACCSYSNCMEGVCYSLDPKLLKGPGINASVCPLFWFRNCYH